MDLLHVAIKASSNYYYTVMAKNIGTHGKYDQKRL